jgi:hypothetical protein
VTKAVKETDALTVLHDLKQVVQRRAFPEGGRLILTMRGVLDAIKSAEEYARRIERERES